MSQVGRSLLFLGGAAVVAGGLGLYAYYGVAKPAEADAQRKDNEQRVLAAGAGLKAADGGAAPDIVFTSLVVKAKGQSTRLEKKDGAWRIVEPVAAAGDGMVADQLANALKTARFKDLVEENPTDADLKKYGFASPTFTVNAYGYVPDEKGGGAEDPSRRRELTLTGGIENTFDGSVYVRRDNEKAVRTIEGGTRWSLEKSTFDLRDKEVFGLDEAGMKRIAVHAKTNSYVLERGADKAWHLGNATGELADSSTVSAMLSSFKGLRATAFPDSDAAAIKKEGLDSPPVSVELTPESGDPISLRIAKTDKTRALRIQGSAQTVAEVPDSALTELDRNNSDLRDKSVMSFNREAAAKVVFSKAGAKDIVAVKVRPDGGEESWSIQSPVEGAAQKWKLSSLLWALSSLRAAEIGEASPKSWAKYGLAAPERSVAVVDAEGKLLSRLQLGSAPEGKKDHLYARGARDLVVQVDATRLTDWPASVADLLEKPLTVDGGSEGLKN